MGTSHGDFGITCAHPECDAETGGFAAKAEGARHGKPWYCPEHRPTRPEISSR